MNIPAAPKDPEKRRDFFYIIKNKDIFGTKMEDGKGIQYLYQSDGRLANSAQITGGITSEKELSLLSSVEGFRKLVHSIGVSVETKNPSENVLFIFQMYGRNDIYGGGTELNISLEGNGTEKRIYLSDVIWREDDFQPGQIKVIMEEPEKLAKLNVRLYLNDGFQAPEVNEESEIDFNSQEYKDMLEDSIVSLGDTRRLIKAIDRARSGKETCIAYIGGSITQGAGATPINTECYAYKSYKLFKDKFGSGNNVHFIKAGVGGTPSELGIIRFERDVLRDNTVEPDIIIIEFAVNDEGDETKGVFYESLVKKALKQRNKPAVILLFSVFANDENLQERMIPVGINYNLPMVSIKNAVTSQFYKKDGEGRVLTKNQYFYDIYHPSNTGHRIMADCLFYLMEQAEADKSVANEENSTEKLLLKEPIIGDTFEKIKLLDKRNTYKKAKIMPGGFTSTDNILQCVEMDTSLELVPEFPYNWHYDGTNTEQPYFEMSVTCKALVLVFKDSGETDAAKADIYVDGKYTRTADPYVNGWLHCNPMLIINESTSGSHFVRIEIDSADREKKCTILGFGYVE
ncbi:MAG: SGNH/GDSL hydrolase family protein [Lachnospiraceae bacterium]|nr:SGNH/GDSL hydrolase family protein [Lachnospiraceae bacterium]